MSWVILGSFRIAVSHFVYNWSRTLERIGFLCSSILPLCCIDTVLSPVYSDGPEYSRLSESLKQTHWYAEGHTDPQEEKDERERARSLRQEEEREKKRRESEDRRRLLMMDSSDVEGSYKPRDPSGNLSPHKSKAKKGEKATQPRAIPIRETTALNGESADEESLPPLEPIMTATSSLMGAQYIPVASIQDPQDNPDKYEHPPPRSACCACARDSRFAGVVTCSTAYAVSILTLAFSLFCLIVICVWLAPGLNKIVEERVVLRPSKFYLSSAPQQTPKVRLEVFFYNVTYVKDSQGIPRIHIEDLGPYTYLVKSSKTDVEWNDNSTVSYRVQETFHFQPNSSVGGEDDVINTMDANILAKLSKMEVSNDTKHFHVNFTDGMVRPQTVGSFLMGGDADNKSDKAPSITQKARNLFNSFKAKEHHRKDSEKANQSTSPLYNVYTGQGDIERLNRIYTFNRSRSDRMWPTGHDHYPMSGSADGDFFPPFVGKDDTLAFFYSQTERNLLLQRQKSVTFEGREAYRFALPKVPINVHGTKNDTHGLTTVVDDDDDVITLEDEAGKARSRETFALQYLPRESPFLVSFKPKSYSSPHGNGSQLCDIYLDIHPPSGITLRKRLCHQMSLPVVYPGPKGHGFILPIMWVDWFYENAPHDLDMMNTSYDMLCTVINAKMTLIGIVTVIAFVFAVQMVITCLRIKDSISNCCCRKYGKVDQEQAF